MVALVGMATAYSESTLAQLYKVHGQEGGRGSIAAGRRSTSPAASACRGSAAVFSVCLILSFGLVFNAVQANSIADAMVGAFGLPKLATGLVLAAMTAIVIFGGIKKIATVAEYVVPFMAGGYLLVALVVLVTHLPRVPGMLSHIVGSAFGFQEAAGGIAGGVAAAMMNGVKRGLFSNEAGMGSAPNIAAAATPVPHHPSSQGFVQALGVFIDTLVICSCTALMILLSGAYVPGRRADRHAAHPGGAGRAHRLGRALFRRGGDLLLRLYLDHRQLLLFGDGDGLSRRREHRPGSASCAASSA